MDILKQLLEEVDHAFNQGDISACVQRLDRYERLRAEGAPEPMHSGNLPGDIAVAYWLAKLNMPKGGRVVSMRGRYEAITRACKRSANRAKSQQDGGASYRLWQEVMRDIARELKEENPNFDAAKFLHDIGVAP